MNEKTFAKELFNMMEPETRRDLNNKLSIWYVTALTAVCKSEFNMSGVVLNTRKVIHHLKDLCSTY